MSEDEKRSANRQEAWTRHCVTVAGGHPVLGDYSVDVLQAHRGTGAGRRVRHNSGSWKLRGLQCTWLIGLALDVRYHASALSKIWPYVSKRSLEVSEQFWKSGLWAQIARQFVEMEPVFAFFHVVQVCLLLVEDTTNAKGVLQIHRCIYIKCI